MKFYKNLILIIVVISFSCKSEPVKVIEEVENREIAKAHQSKSDLNISVLLDLSDRIDPKKHPNTTMEYYQRDLGYIETITKTFESHILHKKSRVINDKIQLFVAPEPSDKELNSKIASLKIQFDRFNAKKEKIRKTTALYNNVCNEIYEKAISDKTFVGADIFGFFKNKIANYCVDDSYRNLIIILTDGYMYHKDYIIKDKNKTSYITPKVIKNSRLNTNNWEINFEKGNYGFLPINQNLEKLEVLVLGVNTNKKNPFETDVLKKYWEQWLKEMKVKKHSIKSADLPIHLQDIISDFIVKEKE